MKINNITFVCTGNTCRSVMAEKIFNQMIRETDIKEIIADSAGTAAMPHYSIYGDLKEVMEENGLNADGHVPRMISRGILQKADIVIAMTEKHREEINRRFPGYEKKIFLLSEFAGDGKKNISDPIGRGIEVYRSTFNEIKNYIYKITERLKNDFKR